MVTPLVGREILLELARRSCAPGRGGRQIVTSSAPSSFDCTAASIAVMPPPMTTTRRPTGSVGKIARLAQLGDEVDRVVDAVGVLALGAAAR